MALIKLIYRWVWTPFEEHTMPDGSVVVKPVVADYSSKSNNILMPRSDLRPLALAYVEFLPDQILAAIQDPRLQILESVHSSVPNATVMTKQMDDLGLRSGMTTHDVLLQMYTVLGFEVGYIPAD